jgi:hypothetical protein
VPNLVTVGMPPLAAMERVLRKLKANNIPHYAWYEPDNDWGLTAIATIPLTADSPQRQAMSCYRVYAPEVLSVGTTPSKGDGASSILAGSAMQGWGNTSVPGPSLDAPALLLGPHSSIVEQRFLKPVVASSSLAGDSIQNPLDKKDAPAVTSPQTEGRSPEVLRTAQ